MSNNLLNNILNSLLRSLPNSLLNKKHFLAFAAFIFLGGIAGAQSAGPALSRNVGPIPDAQAFTGWKPVEGYTTSDVDLDKIQKIPLSCAQDSKLYPTQPQQYVKSYHRFNWGGYDLARLTAESEACTLGSKYKNAAGQYPCLRPDIVYNVIMSDTFRDRCGHLYRGYWELLYLKQNENMGTLFSKGRTLYPRPDSAYDKDFYVGGTYAVDVTEFLFLSPLLPGDAANIQESQRRAEQTHSFDPNSLLFISKEYR
jgi:hypothetical protein